MIGGIVPAGSEARIKNVIILVPDGCSPSVQTLAKWYSGKPLQVDEMITGAISTNTEIAKYTPEKSVSIRMKLTGASSWKSGRLSQKITGMGS